MGYNQLSIKVLGIAYTVLILSVHFTSAGLLQAIREAAVPKDMDYKLPEANKLQDSQVSASSAASHVVTPAEENNLLTTLKTSLSKLSSAIQERADLAKNSPPSHKFCAPGDFLCLSKLSGQTMNNQISNAIIKSFGTMMTDMVNTTISRSLVDFMAKHGPTHGETMAEEQKAMMAMTTNVLQAVSGTVIKSFTIFLQMAISGSMRGLLHTVLEGANNLLLKVSEATKHNGPEGTAANVEANEVRSALFGAGKVVPKPSLVLPSEFDPVKTLLQAGALTSLSYPNPAGFDLVTSLKSNLFNGDTNTIDRKGNMPNVLTPYGLVNRNK